MRGCRHAVVLSFALALIGIGYAVVAVAGVAWVYLAAAATWTTGQMLAAPANASIIAQLAPWDMRARYQGVFNLVFPGAFALAPAIGGWSLEMVGSWHWIACGALGLAVAWGHLRAEPARARRRLASSLTI